MKSANLAVSIGIGRIWEDLEARAFLIQALSKQACVAGRLL